MFRKITIAVAALAITTSLATGAQAFTLGSLARNYPVAIHSSQQITLSYRGFGPESTFSSEHSSRPDFSYVPEIRSVFTSISAVFGEGHAMLIDGMAMAATKSPLRADARLETLASADAILWN